MQQGIIKKEEFDAFLAGAVRKGASDIHIKTGAPPTLRLDGNLVHIKSPPMSGLDMEAIAGYILASKLRPPSLEELTQVDLPYSIESFCRFRVSIFKQRGSLSVVLRSIPMDIPTFQTLGLPPVLQKISEEVRGLVLVTGVTGSGKSSTLAAMIDHINHSRSVHIITIEDPIEFIHNDVKARISQREVGTDTENFNAALRAALRQDPDVILVGEIRDHETIDIALKASETGHLVLSTLHTPDAGKTLGRVLALFPPEEQELVRYRLADNLKATISQRLLQRADGKGRVVALEIMIVTGTVKDWLLQMDKPSAIRDIIEKSRLQYEMQTFDQCLTDLYKGGLITLEAAKAAATHPADFVRALHFES
jgi:twitching motility protein PilT